MTTRVMAAVLCGAALYGQAQTPPPPPPPASPLAAAAAAARKGVAPTDPGIGLPLALTFAWPAGMTATIEAERSKTTLMAGQKKDTGAGLRYRMRVSPHRNGRLISFDNFQPMRTLMTSTEEAAVVDALSAFMPSLVVASSGEFLRIDDLTKIKAMMRQFVDEVMKEAPSASVPPNVKALMESLASDEVLTQLASQDWDLFAGAFVGFKGKIGEMTDVDSEEVSPVMPDVMIPMRSTFGALHRIPCEPGRAADSCVVMQMRSVIAPGAMQTVVKKMLEGMKELEGLTYDRFDVITELQTTLEPSTMKPYRITHTKTADFTMTMRGMGTASASVIEKRTYRIKYEQ